MAFIPDLEPQQELQEFFADRQAALDRKEAHLNRRAELLDERERQLKIQEADLWGGLANHSAGMTNRL